MSDVPEIHTKIIATDNPPTGMGEIGVVTVAPAIGNAVFQLTGKRLRHLPMTADAGEEDAGLSDKSAPAAFLRDAAGFLLPAGPSKVRLACLCFVLRRTQMDEKTRTELEAAVYRRLVEHLRSRTDVQNIDLMNLAGFCRNCLSNWMKEAADAQGVSMSKDESREVVYGMPFDEWRKKYQKEASPEQKAAFEKSRSEH